VGVQGAYGILAEVVSHPFPTDAMLFMDWRDEHTASNPNMQESNRWGKNLWPIPWLAISSIGTACVDALGVCCSYHFLHS